jgi:DNA-binding transcriptional LysR family regulator
MDQALEAFIAVVESGTIRAAAQRLHKSEPAINHQLRMLEQEMGTRLFDRVGRRTIPNHSGREVFNVAKPHVDAIEKLRSSLRQKDRRSLEPLRICSVSGFGRYVLVPALRRIDHVRSRLSFGTAEEIWESISRGDADLGFSFKPSFSVRLEFEPVYTEELVLISRHPLRRPTLAGLQTMSFITYEEGDWVFSKWFSAVWNQQPKSLESVQHVDELEEVVTFVQAGRGVSIVPFDSVRAAAQSGGLHIWRPRSNRCINPVYAVTRSGGSPAVAAAVLSSVRAVR